MKPYLIASLRNRELLEITNALREAGHDPFDDWWSAGPEADDYWREHQKGKGLSYTEALAGPAAQHVFSFDKKHLDMCDSAILVMPAGKSGHLELGYMAGQGKPTYILFDREPDRGDVMYNFATDVVFSLEDLIKAMKPEPQHTLDFPDA